MGFIKDRSYDDCEVESVTEPSHKKVDPVIRIPFDEDSVTGISLGDTVTVTLTGVVKSLSTSKNTWDAGVEVELHGGNIKSSNKSDEEKQVDAFMEND